MKRLLTKVEWIFDYYIAYLLYNPRKFDRYHDYMKQKWGEKYTKTYEP